MRKDYDPIQDLHPIPSSHNELLNAAVVPLGPRALLERKIRTAISIFQADGWRGVGKHIAYLLQGRIGPNRFSGDSCYETWRELRRIRHFSERARQLLANNDQMLLEEFLVGDSTLQFPPCQHPEVSIVMVLHNRAELTLACLRSLLGSNLSSYEVVIVDNASTDETPELLRRARGARVHRNEENLHFLRACNQATRLANGKYLLLLNNDSEVQDQSIRQAIETLESSPDIGAVGAKVVLPDGSLQEAGSIIWRDGSCLGYGRGDYPLASAYMFQRDVDFCSAVFLLTPRDLFLSAGCFDEAYAPAYYEETDYCVKLWKRGLRVVYDPRITVRHHEFASSTSREVAIDLQTQHRKIFVRQHDDWLQSQFGRAPENIDKARMRGRAGTQRILLVEDRVPHRRLGTGYPRSNRILQELVKMGHLVTLWPLLFPNECWSEVYSDIPRNVEVLSGAGLQAPADFLRQRHGNYDCVIVSRPHNLRSLLRIRPRLTSEVRVLYDAEAIFSLREIRALELAGRPVNPQQRERMIAEEVSLAHPCDEIICVSEKEAQEFRQREVRNVRVLGHAVECLPTPSDFGSRRGILFVGALDQPNSPNVDSMRWFCRDVFPRVRQQLGAGTPLMIAGRISAELKEELSGESIEILGGVADLYDLYNQARIFVAPTRFAGGIPYKVHEAAARGVPIVATQLIESQLGWIPERELLTGDDSERFAAACSCLYQDCALWTRLRENALQRIAEECSPDEFRSRLRAIIG